MASKQRGRAGGISSARSHTETPARPASAETGPAILRDRLGEEIKVTASHGSRAQTQVEGVTVIGEAVWRVPPERAEFLIQITTSAPTAAQALHDNQLKTGQVAHAVAPLGVQQADLQTISLNVYNLYTPVMQALPYGGLPQIGSGGSPAYAAGA